MGRNCIKAPFSAFADGVELAVMDGLEASRIIHEDPELSRIPIILNSACDEDEMRKEALQAGCTDFIHVPCAPKEILIKVMSHILVG